MAAKGDRERLEPVARQLYVDGRSLTAIEEILGVSRQSLTEWKQWGDWDKAKAAKDNFEADLLETRDTMMQRVKEAPSQAVTYMDTVTKIDALLRHRAREAREAADAIAKQKGEMFLAVIRDLIDYARENGNDELLNALQDNFDEIMQHGREKYAAA